MASRYVMRRLGRCLCRALAYGLPLAGAFASAASAPHAAPSGPYDRPERLARTVTPSPIIAPNTGPGTPPSDPAQGATAPRTLQHLTFQELRHNHARPTKGQRIRLTRIPIAGAAGTVDLELTALPALTPATRFVIGRADGNAPPLSGFIAQDVALFGGHVAGRSQDSTAYVAACPGRIVGWIEIADTRYALGPSGAFRPVRAGNAAVSPASAARDLLDDLEPIERALEAHAITPTSTVARAVNDRDVYRLELAVDTDHAFFARFADANDAAFYVAALYGAIGHIYQRDLGVELQLTYVRLWDTPTDPYATAPDPFLPFVSTWQNTMGHVPRDAAQLLTGRQDVPFSGKAYLGGLCGSQAYCAVGAVRGWTHDLDSDVLSIWDTHLAAHELAHVCNAQHTHSYGIDACIPTPGVEQRGTLMSYCSLHNGGDANIDARFHVIVRQNVRSFLASSACIDLDCNRNGVADTDDLSGGTSCDLNTNAIPDECEDCNANGVLDPTDIATGLADANNNTIPDICESDCNTNALPDTYDIALGADDLDGNRIPDACQPDLDGNNRADYLDIQANMGLDINRNALLDACEDCDDDGIPDSVALADAHNLWVISDAQDVARMFHAGTGVRIRTTSGATLDHPHDLLATPDGRLLVADSGNHRVAEFDGYTGAYIGDLVPPAAGLLFPTGLAVTPDGRLLVADRDGDRVLSFSLSDGTFDRIVVSAGAGGLAEPGDLALSPRHDLLLVTSGATHAILAYHWPSGAFARVFSTTDELTDPRNLTYKPDGRLLVAAHGTGRVLEFDGLDGRFLRVFNAPLFGPDADLQAWALAITIDGDVLVGTHDLEGGNSILALDAATGLLRGDLVSGPYCGLDVVNAIAFVPDLGVDCNHNQMPDRCDLAAGLSEDVNADDIPDECQVDCNGNAVPDMLEFAPRGPHIDCNANAVLDDCEIADGVAADCNTNGVIDACESFLDCNLNGIPDECEPDFDGDGVIDPCDADLDGDGVENASDPCDHSPPGVPHNPAGGPLGDIDDDCAITGFDLWIFAICLDLSGPGRSPLFDECAAVFDFDADADVDLRDNAALQPAATGPDTR